MKGLLFCICFFSVLVLLCGCPNHKDPQQEDLSHILDRAVSNGIVGISCYMWKQDVYEYKTAGLTGIGEDMPTDVTGDHMFRIASQSKMFYGAAVSILIAEERIREDVLIPEYLSSELVEGLTNGSIITVHQLIHHTSGLYDYANDGDAFLDAVYENPAKAWTVEEVLASFVFGKPAINVPGDVYRYSNTNYLLLDLIIENVTGEDSAVFIRNRILDPLNLEHTYVDLFETFDRTMLVHGYYGENPASLLDVRDTLADMPGDGGIVSTPEDIYRFLNGILTNASFPGIETREAFLEVFLPKEGAKNNVLTENSYGAGIVGMEAGGEVFYTHGGDIPGYHSDLFYFPESGKGFCVMISMVSLLDDENNMGEVIGELYASLFQLLE